MRLEESNIDLFDRYLLQVLTDEELTSFKLRIEKDTEFKDEFDNYVRSVSAVSLMGFRTDVGNIISKNEVKIFPFTKPVFWIPIAASILLFIGFFFWTPKNADTNLALFETYYHPYPNVISSRAKENSLDKALQTYSRGEYQNAIHLLKNTTLVSDTTLFYQGLSYLSLRQAEKSLLMFEKVDPASKFAQQVNWYKSMAFLLKGDTKAVVLLLGKIESDQFHHIQAERIIKTLEKGD